jgi:hypothetical protein
MRYYIQYELGIVPDKDTEALRMGTNWHKMLQIYNLQGGDLCPDCKAKPDIAECPICNKTGVVPDGGMDAVVRYLNYAYRETPVGMPVEDWEIERTKLLYSLTGYLWYHGETLKKYTVVNQERYFSVPLKSPNCDRAMPNVQVNGKIDAELVDDKGSEFIREYKSTSQPLGSDSTFWGHLNLDTQTLLYPNVMLKCTGKLYPILYDVWHKPQITPKKLSQAESKKFVEDGVYCGIEFVVKLSVDNTLLEVNNSVTNLEPGAKEGTFAIKETPEMYGARLLQDITTRPEFYFCIKPVPRTHADLEHFDKELGNIYQSIRSMQRNNSWFCNEQQCEATFRCPYIGLCYNNCVPKEGEVPEGFKCIYKEKK